MEASTASRGAAAPAPQEDLAARVVQLENQVKGLMNTVGLLHQKWSLEGLGIPKPDVHVQQTGATEKVVSTPASAALPGRTAASLAQLQARRQAMKLQAAPPPPPSQPLDVSKAEPYSYTPLEPNGDDVRVLALKVSTDSAAPIEGRLVVQKLGQVLAPTDPGYIRQLAMRSAANFTPLSYTWGTATETEKIYIEGKSLTVTRSLFKALLHFRQMTNKLPIARKTNAPETFWWIDAICINQQDLDERGQQVGLMTRLYKSAACVHLWLGDADDESARAMGVVRQLGYQPTSEKDMASWQYIPKPGQTHRPAGPGQDPIKLLDEPAMGTDEEKSANLKALVSLFSRPWFLRVWVRQEVALPRHVKVHCGDEQCTWEELMMTAHMMSFVSNECFASGFRSSQLLGHSTLVSFFQMAASLDEVRKATAKHGQQGAEYIPFKDMIFISRDCLSTDPRDKIYAMLPLISPDEIRVVADYRMSKSDAYEAALLPLLDKSLNFLGACQNPSRENGLPSWVPDFSVPWKAQPIWPYLSKEKSKLYHDVRDGEPKVTHDRENHTLTVQAVLIDKLEKMHPTCAQPEDSHETLTELIQTWYDFSRAKGDEIYQLGAVRYVDTPDYPFRTACYNQAEWRLRCLYTDGDEISTRKPVSYGYSPLHDRLEDDPRYRRAYNLVPDVTTIIGPATQTRRFGHFRRMALGRQLAVSEGGLTGLVPMDAKVGDTFAHIQGSDYDYVLRAEADGKWTVVGSMYFMSSVGFHNSRNKEKYAPQPITLI